MQSYIIYRNEDSRFTKSEESFLSLHVEVMKGLETFKEITKTFKVMRLCHVQKAPSKVAKKRKPSDMNTSEQASRKVCSI